MQSRDIYVRVERRGRFTGGGFFAAFENGYWTIKANRIRNELQAEDRKAAQQKEITDRAEQAAEVRRIIRTKFTTDFGVQAWSNSPSLTANPFPLKDKVVGLRADFQQMISANEAVFGTGATQLLITGLPSTEFTVRGQNNILAVRVVGFKTVQMPVVGQVNIATGAYVGTYRCKDAACLDFFDR